MIQPTRQRSNLRRAPWLAGLRAIPILLVVILGTILFSGSGFAQDSDEEEVLLEPGLYLSWHRPYGQAGATDRLMTACDDTTEIDTLYLSFVAPRGKSAIVSMSGVLLFHPQEGDTLDPFWFFKRGWQNEQNLRIDFDRVARFPCVVLWNTIGNGRVTYDHRSGRGRLDLEFVVPDSASAWAHPNQMYCFARVMIRQKRNFLTGCRQPVCVEFSEVTFTSRGTRAQTLEINSGEHRSVSWNSGDGKVCDSARAAAHVKAWRPRVEAKPSSETP